MNITSSKPRFSTDASNRTGAPGKRALVLGGGGSTGNAWLVGVIAGLFDGGLDATNADLIVGTSAGSTAAIQISRATPPSLLADILAAPTQSRLAPSASGSGGASANHLERMRTIIGPARDASDMRRRLGAAALESGAGWDDSAREQRRTTVASRLPGQSWPDRTILVTAVDARTGEPLAFDRHSGVELVDAICASTANGIGVPPHSIGDGRYLDGGYRRNENADLAAGYERVLVLSPLGGRTMHPLEWGMQLAVQVDELRASGSRVETILPDADSLAAFGDNMMDLSARPPAARAGFEQGRALAGRLVEFWS